MIFAYFHLLFSPSLHLSLSPSLPFFLFLSASGTPSRIISRTFPFTLSLVTCVTCARTRLTYIQETSIIIDSKSRLKHRNAVACLYKMPKNTIPYYGLCCWMTLVTVRWLLVGSFSFRSFRLFHLDPRHLASPEKSFIPPDKTRLSVLIAVSFRFDFFFFLICRANVRNSIRNREDSIRDESGEDNTSEARESSVDRNSFLSLFRPRDNRLPVNIRAYWLVEFCEMYICFFQRYARSRAPLFHFSLFE